MKQHFLAGIFFIAFVHLSAAQSIDSIVKDAVKAYQNSGVRKEISIGIIQGNHTYTYHFSSDSSTDNTPTAASIYEIGSVTKTFTGLILANAVAENKVKLTDDIRLYLTGKYPNLEYQGKPIQLVQLANFTSGLPDNLPEQVSLPNSASEEERVLALKKIHDLYTRKQFFSDLRLVKLNHLPGAYPAHSNTAAQLLGFILENVYHTTYDKLLKKYMTTPLLMSSTYTVVPLQKQPLLLKGYNGKGTEMPQIPADAGAAGGLKSTLKDMIGYLRYQLGEESKVVALSHQLQWGSMQSLGIGLNWYMKNNFDDYRKLWASGGTFGFASYLAFYPARNFGIVVLSNENDNSAEDALDNFAQNIYNELYFSPAERTAITFGFSKSIVLLYNALETSGFTHENNLIDSLQKHSNFYLDENEMNMFGYKLMQKADKREAIEFFKINVKLYPNSANTYDSLAEAYAAIGDKQMAIKNYQRSIELNPQNTNAVEQLKKLQ